MDHLVYLDYKAKELSNLIAGKKTMIARGAAGRKLPYGKASVGDQLYLIETNGDGLVKAKAKIDKIFFSEKLTKEDSSALIDKYQSKLIFNTALMKRFAGKRYLTLITLSEFNQIKHPFKIDKTAYSNMDDWLLIEKIENVKLQQ